MMRENKPTMSDSMVCVATATHIQSDSLIDHETKGGVQK